MWRTPIELLGGIEDNPGVSCHGGGVVCTEVCILCGCEKVTDSWAQNPVTSEQGLDSVEYLENVHDIPQILRNEFDDQCLRTLYVGILDGSHYSVAIMASEILPGWFCVYSIHDNDGDRDWIWGEKEAEEDAEHLVDLGDDVCDGSGQDETPCGAEHVRDGATVEEDEKSHGCYECGEYTVGAETFDGGLCSDCVEAARLDLIAGLEATSIRR